ncbi:hypothetical protein LINPERPRIM_LOCUS11118 [Linum perenne]
MEVESMILGVHCYLLSWRL